MNFRNSDCVTVCVDYVEMVLVQCAPNTLLLTLAPVLVELRVLSLYSSTSMLTGKFCTNILYSNRKLFLYHSKNELPQLSALARYSV